MAKLRHITLSVDDMEKTATFYEQAFEMKRVRQSGVAIMMSDGVVSLAIIDANRNANSNAKKGLHHMGFLVEDLNEAVAKVEKSGGTYAGQIKNIGEGPRTNTPIPMAYLSTSRRRRMRRRFGVFRLEENP